MSSEFDTLEGTLGRGGDSHLFEGIQDVAGLLLVQVL